MSELHKFLFDGLPVRGMVVRVSEAWTEMLRRRSGNTETGRYPQPVQNLLGEMVAAAALMQANIKFDGSLVLQVFGDGPLKVAVVEVQPDLGLRATATLVGEVPAGATLGQMLNVHGQGRCAITLDPRTKFPGQQPYQGVVPLTDSDGRTWTSFAKVLEHYMLQSEQLDTTLVLAADDNVAAGLLIQRLPVQGEGNLSGSMVSRDNEAEIGRNEDYNRIATLGGSLKRDELLTLDVDTVLRRLFWEETVTRFEPLQDERGPRFVCNCSRERVGRMIVNLGREEVEDILSERGNIEVACEFCGLQYRFDPVDAAQLFVDLVQRGQGVGGPTH